MDEGFSGNGDATPRRRLASILRDPSAYYADARREARAEARRLLAARMRAPGAHAR